MYITTPLTPQMLNEYFSTVGNSLTKAYTDSLPPWGVPDCIHTLKFNLTSVECVTKCISTLPRNTNLDVLNMDCKVIRTGAECIARNVCALFKQSHIYRIVPSILRSWIVLHLYLRKRVPKMMLVTTDPLRVYLTSQVT